MPFDFLFRPEPAPPPVLTKLQVGERTVTLHHRRHPRARRYVLRVRADGSAQVTIPRHGSRAAGTDFARSKLAWIADQLEKIARRPRPRHDWRFGTEILFRGELVVLEAGPESGVCFADQLVAVPDPAGDLRPAVERCLWRLATAELTRRTLELATAHDVVIRRVTVRNQRSRWGSCSVRGTISLNWRLIQTSAFVRDYIILHELMHRRHMNHSARFWAAVEQACPDYRAAEQWLKQHDALLRAGR